MESRTLWSCYIRESQRMAAQGIPGLPVDGARAILILIEELEARPYLADIEVAREILRWAGTWSPQYDPATDYRSQVGAVWSAAERFNERLASQAIGYRLVATGRTGPPDLLPAFFLTKINLGDER